MPSCFGLLVYAGIAARVVEWYRGRLSGRMIGEHDDHQRYLATSRLRCIT